MTRPVMMMAIKFDVTARNTLYENQDQQPNPKVRDHGSATETSGEWEMSDIIEERDEVKIKKSKAKSSWADMSEQVTVRQSPLQSADGLRQTHLWKGVRY